jgi:hypothetical protein
MEITAENAIQQFDSSALRLAEALTLVSRHVELSKSTRTLSIVSRKLTDSARAMALAVDAGILIDPDGKKLARLEGLQHVNAQLRLSSRSLGLLFVNRPLREAQFSILQARHAILEHDLGESIPAPVRMHVHFSSIMQAISGAPWNVKNHL